MEHTNIAISGKMASGKSMLADYFCKNFGYHRYAFAQPMKEMELLHQHYKMDKIATTRLADELTPYIDKLNLPFTKSLQELLDLYERIPLVLPKNREFLQQMGTEVVRRLNDNAWVDYAKAYIAEMPQPVIVDDLRFTNEADGLKEMGFFLIRLEVDETERQKRIKKLYGEEALAKERLLHISETQLDKYKNFNLEIFNNYNDKLNEYANAVNVILTKGR